MKRIVLLAMLALTAVFATACGGENNEPAPAFSFDVTGNDNFVYEPAALTVKASSQVTVNFTASNPNAVPGEDAIVISFGPPRERRRQASKTEEDTE